MAEKLRDLTFSPETIQDDTNLLLGGELAAGFATDILNRLFGVSHAHGDTPLLQFKSSRCISY